MSAKTPGRTLVYLRKKIFRYLSLSPSATNRPTGTAWASCNTPIEPQYTIQNPSTSFERIVEVKPQFGNFTSFPKPCKDDEE